MSINGDIDIEMSEELWDGEGDYGREEDESGFFTPSEIRKMHPERKTTAELLKE